MHTPEVCYENITIPEIERGESSKTKAKVENLKPKLLHSTFSSK